MVAAATLQTIAVMRDGLHTNQVLGCPDESKKPFVTAHRSASSGEMIDAYGESLQSDLPVH